jgi:NAD(P)H-nitrite reductase large subunit
MKYVVIGSGVAGVAAIEAIRSLDGTGEVVMIGDDPHGYYSRPGLAYYLTGEVHDQSLFPKKREDYLSLRFNYLKGSVKQILRDQKKLVIEGKGQLPYDRLLLAVGAFATPLDIPGSKLGGVLKLDHLDDAKQIIKLARKGKTAVVVGGGITALELVEGLVARGMTVHYLLRGDRYWSNVLDEQESKIVEHRLKEEGVKLHYHTEIVELFGKQNHIRSVRLKDGSVIPCDLLTYAIGIRPRTDLAKEASLDVDRGILVNEYLQTNDPNIFAAGDVAQVYDPLTNQSVLDSLWSPAREQGTIAGLNMAGQKKAYIKPVPFNVTRLAGLTTTIIGAVGRGRDEDLVGIARGDSETWRQLPDAIVAQTGFDVNRLRVLVGDKVLLGAIVMGDQTLSFPLEKLISNNVDISDIRDQLLAPNVNIANVIAGFWARMVKSRLT